jgi:hypothetical protein
MQKIVVKLCSKKIPFPVFVLLFFLMGSPAFSQGFLKASDKKIVGADGKEVLLRGIGLGGWMLQEPYMLQLSGIAYNQGNIRNKIKDLIGEKNTETFYRAWRSNFCRKSDIDSLASWGFNSVRLPMHYNLFTLPADKEPVAGRQTWLPQGFEMVDSLLSWCRANKMYLILDLHAAPGGQGNDYSISDRDSTKPSLWQDERARKKTIALWKKLAQRYASEEWIGGYDLLNETNWGFQNAADRNGCAESDNEPLRKFLMEITAAVREADQNHLIIIEANCWANNYKGVLPPWDPNMAISFHKYWNDNNQSSVQQFVELRNQYNLPVWMGESGENSNSWFRSAVALLEKNDMGWAWWPHKKMGINNPFQIKANPGYRQVVDYWKGQGPRPSSEKAFQAFMQLAADSKTENTIYHKDVVDALFRQVNASATLPFIKTSIDRDPVLYAVNYDLGALGEAYYDTDSANYRVTTGQNVEWNKGKQYRNDGVDIEACTDSLSNGFQVVSIEPSEWMQYTVYANEAGRYDLQIRVYGPDAASLSLFVNQKEAVHDRFISPSGQWYSLTYHGLSLRKGENKIRIKGNKGEFALNYLRFTRQDIASVSQLNKKETTNEK